MHPLQPRPRTWPESARKRCHIVDSSRIQAGIVDSTRRHRDCGGFEAGDDEVICLIHPGPAIRGAESEAGGDPADSTMPRRHNQTHRRARGDRCRSTRGQAVRVFGGRRGKRRGKPFDSEQPA